MNKTQKAIIIGIVALTGIVYAISYGIKGIQWLFKQ